jgi:hypothetical protein
MPEKPGEFVLISNERCGLTRDVNAATGDAERVYNRQVYQDDADLQFGRRKVGKNSLRPRLA